MKRRVKEPTPMPVDQERTFEELQQMCDAPSGAYTAGEWCFAANELIRACLALRERETLALNQIGRLIGERDALLRMTQPEPREGIVTVYDHEGCYLGCMGIERWQSLLVEDAGEPLFCPWCGHAMGMARPEEEDENQVVYEHRSSGANE